MTSGGETQIVLRAANFCGWESPKASRLARSRGVVTQSFAATEQEYERGGGDVEG